jgi:hypothetical protein
MLGREDGAGNSDSMWKERNGRAGVLKVGR